MSQTRYPVANQVEAMFASIAERYDLNNSVLSLGIHHLWKRRLGKMVSCPAGGTVVDLCTGTGDLLPLLKGDGRKVIGVDFCEPMLELARKKSDEFQLIRADALNLPFESSSIDVITVAFGVRNFENLKKGLTEIHRVLKPKGQLLILEFGQPGFPPFRWLYNLYSKYILPPIGGLLSGNTEAYRYLDETASHFPSGKAFVEELSEAGFCSTRASSLSRGIAWIYNSNRRS